jgi:DNA modification methylase
MYARCARRASGSRHLWRRRLFGGSGSTLIAAEQTGRRAFLLELDPLYCDVIVARWEQFTGQPAERAAP